MSDIIETTPQSEIDAMRRRSEAHYANEQTGVLATATTMPPDTVITVAGGNYKPASDAIDPHFAQPVCNHGSLARACEVCELQAIASEAVRLGKQQADEWDRFWAAMGVLSADITVDQAIEKYQALQAENARLRDELRVAIETVDGETREVERLAARVRELEGAIRTHRHNMWGDETPDAERVYGAEVDDALYRALEGSTHE